MLARLAAGSDALWAELLARFLARLPGVALVAASSVGVEAVTRFRPRPLGVAEVDATAALSARKEKKALVGRRP